MTPVLAIRDGSIGYGSVSLVRDLNLAVEAGEFICLLGPNGAGKTTLLRALAGLGALLSGDVLLDGRSLRRCSRATVSTRIAVVLTESLAIPGMTVGELVRLGRHPFTDWKGSLSDADLSAVRKALAVMDLTGWEDRVLPELSDGERQRAAIARALAQESDILLLDEPTTYLDLTHRAEVLRILRDVAWKNGRAVVAALHDLDLALRYADRAWLFDPKADPSRVIGGGPEDLLLSGAVERVFSSRSVRYDPLDGTFELRNGAPFADLPAPLRQLKHGLGRHAGGDRIMAQVLAAVPVAGLDAVLVAVELVLESGSLSAEHILNVVARLAATEPPPSVETHLSLKEAPVANTARYDRLRGQTEEIGHA